MMSGYMILVAKVAPAPLCMSTTRPSHSRLFLRLRCPVMGSAKASGAAIGSNTLSVGCWGLSVVTGVGLANELNDVEDLDKVSTTTYDPDLFHGFEF